MASKKRTYISIINDFWEQDAQNKFSASATRVYFFLLNLINRNRWEPVFISNTELADGARVSRRGLPSYKAEIANAGLLCIQDQGIGRQAGTVYSLPETAQKGAVNCAKRNSLNDETAQKGTVNCAKRNSLKPATHINIDNKTYIRPYSKTSEDRARALAHARKSAAVEIKEIEILSGELEKINGAAAELEKKKKMARAQGREIMASFFAASNRQELEEICMANYVTPEQLYQTAAKIVGEWAMSGKTHNGPCGNFDLGDGVDHLRLTIPSKLAAEARAAARPKTRDEHRRELMDATTRDFYEACQKDLTGAPRQEDNFDPPF